MTSPIPLSPAEKITVERLLVSRTGTARVFSLAAGIATALFILRMWGRSRYSTDDRLLVLAEPFILAGVAALVWYFGWAPVTRLRQDLAAGVKEVRVGAISRLDRIDNAYGETITWATVGGDKLFTKSDVFNRFQVGDRVSVEILPKSKVAFAAARAQ